MIENILSGIKNGRFIKDIQSVFSEEYSVIPGFVDTHAHMAEHGFFLQYPSLSDLKSKDELIEFVASTLKQGKLNVFVDYDDSQFIGEKEICKSDLDKISRSTPIVLRRVCGHIAVLNSPAIEYFKDRVPCDTLDVEKGIAFEYLPLNLYELLSPDIKEIENGILKAQERYLKKGITGILDFAKDVRVFDAYLNLDQKGELKIKVSVAFYESAYPYLLERGFYTGWEKGRVKIEGIKLFVDGSVGGRTASFYVPYKDADSVLPFYTSEILKAKIKEYEKNGFKVLMHAIGTRAINTALSAIPEHADFNHRIEHFEFPAPDDIKTAHRKRVYISMQPNFVVRWWKMYKEAVKEDVFSLMHPYRRMMEEDIGFAFGSDSMPEGPLYGLRGAIEHPFKSERLTFNEAVMYYTEKGQRLLGLKTGKMAKDFYADFLVLDSAGKIRTVFVEGERIL